MPKKTKRQEMSECCQGMDMFVVVKYGLSGQRIRRYKWDPERQMHKAAEYIKPNGRNIQAQLIDLRMQENERLKNGIDSNN